ncbi:Retrovirus-related Pol polyprotein from transposon RE1 [Vitis vinifera]|uniref:Retrovirus-related Pol polyprotein from transposon RE1 n=1 Tax=Vitis vinifera TaxID=29760 RepID=A0A438DTA4_VITVI|nr:Retrovirus-related Pol polyprotein from transposon RE1 [Vitis vinifera]
MELPPGFDEERTNGKSVDDIILTGDDVIDMERLKQKLATEFEMKDLGSLRYFLGMEVARNKIGISVSQRKHVLDLLGETGLVGCKPVETPVDSNVKIDTQKVNNPIDSGRYQHLVGKLIYLSYTRPDIAFAVSWVSQIMHAPAEEHMVAVYRILKYLKGTLGRGLFFGKNGEGSIEAYIDVDWAGAIDDRKSTSGYCTFVWGNLVTWRSKKQTVIARSIAKVELRSVAHGICEVLWLQIFLEELEVMVKLPLRIYCDNKAAINISHNQFIIIGRSMLKLIGISSSKKLRMVAAWDANLVTPHKRMGNAAISLECLCDGNLHEVLLELEGMGGGGKIQLEISLAVERWN